ncbi:hypothetical protein CAAN3_04S02520 [[Candida] anglica]
MTKVFLTGATGYIGGEVLYQLLNSKDHQFEVSALVRSQAKADLLVKKTDGKVTPILGSLDDLEVIKSAVFDADIVINTANVDHVPSAQILSESLLLKKTPTILIHTSGTSVVGDDLSAVKGPTDEVYSDISSIAKINSLPDEQPHRPVDKIILDIQDQNPNVKVAVVCPSTIFGLSNGYDKINSVQIPDLIRYSIKNKQAFSVYSGAYIWSHIDIKDLGDLYYLILDSFLQKKNIPSGKEGYYFGSYTLENETVKAEPSEIEHTWRQVSQKIADVLLSRGLIPTSEVVDLTPEEIVKLSGDNFAPYYWGSNSRTRGDNGKKIGFAPKYTTSQRFWDSIEIDLDHILKA